MKPNGPQSSESTQGWLEQSKKKANYVGYNEYFLRSPEFDPKLKVPVFVKFYMFSLAALTPRQPQRLVQERQLLAGEEPLVSATGVGIIVANTRATVASSLSCLKKKRNDVVYRYCCASSNYFLDICKSNQLFVASN